ncbi:ABC transporter substrate-binding protein [Paenibacillus gorillae]|uniref:ABC transporter substrate-binding protein n=1 Tax=Paenibacillus gorillae TaxID=1243662 RepID=UPI0004AE6E14|nr:ABC transporter substrate-binding protein [Paenibacillus gorillae]
MKKVRFTALVMLLACSMALAACGSSNGGTKNGGQASNAPESKIEELTVAFPMVSSAQQDIQLVEDAVNKITEQKIQARVKFMPISAGEWQQQTNLLFTSNEKLDLMFVNGSLYSGMVAKGQLIPIDELISKYGGGITKALGDYLQVARLKDGIYAVPTIRDLATSYGITFRKDLADKYSIDVSKLNTMEDIEHAFKTIKDGEGGDFTPLIPSGVGATYLENYLTYDRLGDGIGILPDYDNGLKIVNLYETDTYKEQLKRIRDWYLKGYIMKDSATNKLSTFELLRGGKGFAYFAALKPGFEEQESQASGVQVVTKELLSPIATTSTVTGAMWGIPVNTKLEGKAMEFLNLMYEDKDIINLFDWGIEGKHYVKVPGEDNVIDYPEGVTAQTTGYNMPLGWLFGNQFLSYVMKGKDADIWNKMDAFNKNAAHSKALGFSFDAAPVKTEYAAVTNVITQYKLALETGSVDPDKVLPDFINKLKSAGIDKIIQEKQKQLDAWVQAGGSK